MSGKGSPISGPTLVPTGDGEEIQGYLPPPGAKPPAAEPPPPPVPQAAASGAERRQNPRLALQAHVTLSSQDNLLMGLASDLSVGGIYVAGLSPPPVGEKVLIELQMGEDDPIRLEGVVRWHREGEDGAPGGCGVQFVDLAPTTSALLTRLLERLGKEPLLDLG